MPGVCLEKKHVLAYRNLSALGFTHQTLFGWFWSSFSPACSILTFLHFSTNARIPPCEHASQAIGLVVLV